MTASRPIGERIFSVLMLLLFVPPVLVFAIRTLTDAVEHASWPGLFLLVFGAWLFLQFHSDFARIAALTIVLCVVPGLLHELLGQTSSIKLLMGLIVVSSSAYLILRQRHEHPERPPRIQGAERTSVLPPGDEP